MKHAKARLGIILLVLIVLGAFAERAYASPASASADDLRAFARSHIQSQFHPVGTCAMGLVVDPELRVLGVEGLRVVALLGAR